MWLTIESIIQMFWFIVIFTFGMTLSLLLFFKLKEWLIDKSKDEELKKANRAFNEMINEWQEKFK